MSKNNDIAAALYASGIKPVYTPNGYVIKGNALDTGKDECNDYILEKCKKVIPNYSKHLICGYALTNFIKQHASEDNPMAYYMAERMKTASRAKYQIENIEKATKKWLIPDKRTYACLLYSINNAIDEMKRLELYMDIAMDNNGLKDLLPILQKEYKLENNKTITYQYLSILYKQIRPNNRTADKQLAEILNKELCSVAAANGIDLIQTFANNDTTVMNTKTDDVARVQAENIKKKHRELLQETKEYLKQNRKAIIQSVNMKKDIAVTEYCLRNLLYDALTLSPSEFEKYKKNTYYIAISSHKKIQYLDVKSDDMTKHEIVKCLVQNCFDDDKDRLEQIVKAFNQNHKDELAVVQTVALSDIDTKLTEKYYKKHHTYCEKTSDCKQPILTVMAVLAMQYAKDNDKDNMHYVLLGRQHIKNKITEYIVDEIENGYKYVSQSKLPMLFDNMAKATAFAQKLSTQQKRQEDNPMTVRVQKITDCNWQANYVELATRKCHEVMSRICDMFELSAPNIMMVNDDDKRLQGGYHSLKHAVGVYGNIYMIACCEIKQIGVSEVYFCNTDHNDETYNGIIVYSSTKAKIKRLAKSILNARPGKVVVTCVELKNNGKEYSLFKP